MANRCNPCRHTSAPFPIARSIWDMKQNSYFCPDCQADYTLDINKFPLPAPPRGNCFCGCKPCCCRQMCEAKPAQAPMNLNPCYPPHPAVQPVLPQPIPVLPPGPGPMPQPPGPMPQPIPVLPPGPRPQPIPHAIVPKGGSVVPVRSTYSGFFFY